MGPNRRLPPAQRRTATADRAGGPRVRDRWVTSSVLEQSEPGLRREKAVGTPHQYKHQCCETDGVAKLKSDIGRHQAFRDAENHGREECAADVAEPTHDDDRQGLERDDHGRSEEHTSELQSLRHLVCRLLLEKKKKKNVMKIKSMTFKYYKMRITSSLRLSGHSSGQSIWRKNCLGPVHSTRAISNTYRSI